MSVNLWVLKIRTYTIVVETLEEELRMAVINKELRLVFGGAAAASRISK